MWCAESLSDSFGVTMTQRGNLFEQLRLAEQETKDALLTLYLVEQEADKEVLELRRCINNARKKCAKGVLDKLVVRAMSTSKSKWEEEWDYEWVDSDDEATGENPIKPPVKVDVPPIPPITSSQVPNLSSLNAPGEQPKASGSGTSHDDKNNKEDIDHEYNPYKFDVPQEFIRMFGPVKYSPIVTPGPLRMPQKRNPCYAMEADPEATRQMLRTRGRHNDLEDDLRKIVRPDTQKMPAIDWRSYREAFGEVGESARGGDFLNPFASS
jgi:hypothetical protein